MKLSLTKSFLVFISAVSLLNACDDKANNSISENKLTEVKIGLVGEHDVEWKLIAKNLEKENIKLTLVKFSDYSIPNRALNDGEVDLNSFQTRTYLNTDSKANGYKLTSIGDTIICPLGAYSQKIKNLSELKDGDLIAIPNDPSNGGRALKLLESAGLIKLDPSKGYLPGVRDIVENHKHLKLYEVDAGNTPSLLPDVAVSVINAGYAHDSNLNPLKDAIYLDATDKVSDTNPYVNIIVAREKDKDNPLFKKVVKAYQTKEVAKLLLDEYDGSYIPVFPYKQDQVTKVRG